MSLILPNQKGSESVSFPTNERRNSYLYPTKFWYLFNLTKSFYILFIFCVGLAACADTYNPDVDPIRSIVVELEIAPGEDPAALIHITNSIVDTSDSIYYPIDDEAEINLTDSPDEVGRMSYAQTPGLYTSLTTPIVEGETYYLKIEVPSKDVEPLYAETTVPIAEKIDSLTINTSSLNVVGNLAYGEIDLTVHLPEAITSESYFQLLPAIKNGEQASMGTVQYDIFTRKQLEILTDNNAIKQYIHKDGIFIDNTMLETNSVGLKLIYQVNPLYVDEVDSVSFTLRTINKESMVYHENTDRELRISSLPLDDPQISDNNIENGYGLFGAYSSSTIIIPID